MYTNMANLQQTMLLQQRLFRQALVRQTPAAAGVNTAQHHKHYTAPSLSQYQFVSSQQVIISKIKTQNPLKL